MTAWTPSDTWHPGTANMIWSAGCLANVCAYFTFKGKTAHAAASPHLGRSALDACELMNVGVNYLREHIVPEARVHYAYQDVGGPAPNVVQNHAQTKYFIRAPKIRQVLEIVDRIKDIARGAALMTGTQVDIDIPAGMCDFVSNEALSRVLADAFQAVGAPAFDDADRALAGEFFKNYSDAEIQASLDRMYPGLRRSGSVPELSSHRGCGSLCEKSVLPVRLHGRGGRQLLLPHRPV